MTSFEEMDAAHRRYSAALRRIRERQQELRESLKTDGCDPEQTRKAMAELERRAESLQAAWN